MKGWRPSRHHDSKANVTVARRPLAGVLEICTPAALDASEHLRRAADCYEELGAYARGFSVARAACELPTVRRIYTTVTSEWFRRPTLMHHHVTSTQVRAQPVRGRRRRRLPAARGCARARGVARGPRRARLRRGARCDRAGGRWLSQGEKNLIYVLLLPKRTQHTMFLHAIRGRRGPSQGACSRF